MVSNGHEGRGRSLAGQQPVGLLVLSIKGAVLSADARAQSLLAGSGSLVGAAIGSLFPDFAPGPDQWFGGPWLAAASGGAEPKSFISDSSWGRTYRLRLDALKLENRALWILHVEEALGPEGSRLAPGQRLLALIAEQTASEVYMFDAETSELCLVNRRARRNLRCRMIEIIHRPMLDFISPAHVAVFQNTLKALLDDEADHLAFRIDCRRLDGTTYPFEGTAQTGIFDGRRVVLLIGLDATDGIRRAAKEDILARLESCKREALDSADFLERAGAIVSAHIPASLCCVTTGDAPRVERRHKWIAGQPAAWHADFRSLGAAVLGVAPGQSFDLGAGVKVQLATRIDVAGNSGGIASIAAFVETSAKEIHLDAGISDTIGRIYEARRAEEALADARERFDAAVQGADVGLWDYNYRSGEFFLSPRSQELLGIDTAPIKPDWEGFGSRLHPDDVERTREAMRRHFNQRVPYDAEYRIRRPDGEYVWLKVHGKGVWDANEIVRTAGTLTDISSEKEAEYLRRDVMTVMTSDGPADEKIVRALDRACRYLRMPESVVSHVSGDRYEVVYAVSPRPALTRGNTLSLAAMLCSDVFSTDAIQAHSNLAESPLANHPARSAMEVEAYVGAPIFVKGSRFGTLSFLSRTSLPTPFSESKIAIVRLLAQWISDEMERASYLASLQESNARKTANLESVGDAVLTINDLGCIEDANPAAARLFGWDSLSLRRMHIAQLLPAAPSFSTSEGGLRPVNARQDIAARRNGERFAIRLHVSEVRLMDRRLFTVVVTDLTAIKQAELAKREFVSVVSHELRTPLTSIRGALALIARKNDTLPPATAHLVNVAKKNSERLVTLVNDILDMEKLETGKFEVSLKPINLRAILQEAVAANAAYAERFGVTLRLECAEAFAPVIADPDRLLQVMANLLSNAAKFSEPDTEVLVRVAPQGSFARIEVQDSGPGVPESLRPHLFEKFAQADNLNTRKREGSGLGLSITRSLMRLMNGDVGYRFEPGKGSTFFVDFPVSLETSEFFVGGLENDLVNS